MRKVGKLINIFISIFFGITALALVYVGVVPDHIKALMPKELNWLTVIIVGIATGGAGSGLVYLKHFLNKERQENTSGLESLTRLFISQEEKVEELTKHNDKLEKILNNILSEKNKENINVENLTKRYDRLIKLVETDLETKLTNPLIDKSADEKIRGVLNEKENNNS